MYNKIAKKVLPIISILIIAYILICDAMLTFSISVTLYFIAMGVLLYALYYVIINPINYKERGPSFIYTFIKVSTILFFAATFILISVNLLYPKNYLSSDEKYDYIIVFGAGVKEDGVNEIINSRLDNAIVYAKKYEKCKFVLTGAKGYDEPIEEAYYMSNYMEKNGIDSNRIIAEPFSVNTYQSIKNSLELIKTDVMKRNARESIVTRPFINKKDVFDLDFLNIGFMSSDFHLSRINMMSKKAGVSKPYDIVCITNPLYLVYMYVRENLSLFKAFILYQI